MTKEDLISKYKELRNNLGRKPNVREFRSLPGISDKAMSRVLGRSAFSKLVQMCGDVPNRFGQDKSDLYDILKRWGELTREIGLIPTQTEWDESGNKPSFSGIIRSHNLKWSDLPFKFYEIFHSEPYWADVIEILDIKENDTNSEELKNSECYVYLMKDFRNNTYKIGISNDAIFRERTLQSQQPKIELIAKKKYVNRKIAGAIEKALHSIYEHKHSRGEWFRLDEEDIMELKSTLSD